MHDWTLHSISMDWESGSAICSLAGPKGTASIVAKDVAELRVPRNLPWGRSVSVNQVTGPTRRDDGLFLLSIEMQSGDTIEVAARAFESVDL